MQQNQPVIIITFGVCVAVVVYVGRIFLALAADGNLSATSIATTFSIVLAAGIGFVFFLRHDFQSRIRNYRVQYPSSVSAKPGAKTRPVIELMSAIVIILTIVGIIVGAFFPGKITGAILPLALLLWFVLYKWMVHNNYNY